MDKSRVAADILIAIIGAAPNMVNATAPKESAEKLAEAYKIIFKAVSEAETKATKTT